MKKILLIFLLLTVLLLSGCTVPTNSDIVLSENEMSRNDIIKFNVEFNYFSIPSNKNQAFSIKFITEDFLSVKKDMSGSSIEEDLLVAENGKINATYYLEASYFSFNQKATTIEAVISSSDGEFSKKISSDFILVKK